MAADDPIYIAQLEFENRKLRKTNVDLHIQVEDFRIELIRLCEGLKVRKVHKDWPAIDGVINVIMRKVKI